MGRKKRTQALTILSNGSAVGILTRNSTGAIEFAYAQSWIAGADPVPVSLSLPVREEPYRDAKVRFFFDNLLPDNDRIRQQVAEQVGADSIAPFDLLSAIGRDCVGALQFVPEGEEIRELPEIRSQQLSDAEVAAILRNLTRKPLGISSGHEFRISIAGAQEKTALLKLDDEWHLPLGITPTTHILKRPLGVLDNRIDLSDSVENEWLCLKLADFFGLPVARAERMQFEDQECLVVERFDRIWRSNQRELLRLPQEDLCQALGVPSGKKYESNGGPSIRSIMQLLDASDERETDRHQFMRAQLFFWLMGAIDGHAKNFSIFLTAHGFRLTPLYDILSVYPAHARREIEPKETKLAMSVGLNRHYELHEIQRRHWEQTANEVGYPVHFLETLIDEMENKCRKLELFAASLKPVPSAKLIEPILAGVQRALKFKLSLPE